MNEVARWRDVGWSVDVSGVIRFWDYLAQQCRYTIDEHRPSRQTLGIALNCTADKIVSFGADITINVYDIKTKARVSQLSHTYVRTHVVGCTPDNTYRASPLPLASSAMGHWSTGP